MPGALTSTLCLCAFDKGSQRVLSTSTTCLIMGLETIEGGKHVVSDPSLPGLGCHSQLRRRVGLGQFLNPNLYPTACTNTNKHRDGQVVLRSMLARVECGLASGGLLYRTRFCTRGAWVPLVFLFWFLIE